MFKVRVSRRDEQQEYIDCYSVEEFNDFPLSGIKTVKKYLGFGGKSISYCEKWACFDIETSHNHNEDNLIGWCYQWAFYFNGSAFVGRKPSEFMKLLKLIHSDKDMLVIFVHNLAYEFSYLYQFLHMLDDDIEMLAISTHKPITIKLKTLKIEFRCSYRLSNMSLNGWCEKYKTLHTKAVGAIDYDVIRYQDTPLDLNTDWYYMLSDVVCMDDALHYELKGFTIANAPITSTGFVRDDMRKAYKLDPNNRKEFRKTMLNFEQYRLLKAVFAGGLTHGNRWKANLTIKGNIKHFDFRSFYPSVIATQLFPMGPFTTYYDYEADKTTLDITEIETLSKDYCLLICLEMEDVSIIKGVTLPYLQIDKIRKQNIGNFDYKILKADNGRALQVKGRFNFIATELDYEIIKKQYHCEALFINKILISQKGKLPKWFLDNNDKYFHAKLNLKGVDNDLYMKSKNKLNAQYGMSASDPIHNIIEVSYESGEWSEENQHKDEDTCKGLLKKYYASHNSFMRYQWGVWVTAYCRNMLVKMVELVGYENFLYCDTDSIFYVDDGKNTEKLYEWNKENYNTRIERGEYIINEKTGEPYEYLAFEDEDDGITEFKFLHAKCYGFIGKEGLQVTIAGVPKKGKGITREEELQSLDNLQNGFIFKKCGGTRISYNYHAVENIKINGHKLEVGSSGVILDKEYEVGYIDEEKYIGYEYV